MLPILHQSYWRDEAFSVLLSFKSIGEIFSLTIKDASPPLYYFLLHFWIKLFGDAEYVTRSLSLLFHFLLVLSSFLLLKHLLKNWKISLMGGLTVLLNPFLLHYAFEARCYTLFAFFTVTAVFFYLKRKYLLSSLFLALMILTHNFAIFFLFAFIASWIYQKISSWTQENIKETNLNLSSFAPLFTLPLLTFLVWLKFFWNQWVRVAEGFWVKPQGSSIFINAFRVFFQGNKDYPSKGMLYNLTIVLVFFAFYYWVTKLRSENPVDKNGLTLAFLFSLPFLIIYIISAFWIPIYHERFLIPVLPLFIIWATYSLYKLSKLNKNLRHLIFAVSLAYVLFAVQSSEEILRKTTKPAINYGVKEILSKAQSGDVIIPENNLNFLETKYYVKKSGKDIPVYAYSPDGKIVFYIGAVLFEEQEIITDYPKDKRVWAVTSNGGNYLKGD